jgi:hypothetical protein
LIAKQKSQEAFKTLQGGVMGKRVAQLKKVFVFLVLCLSSLFILTVADVNATEFGGGAYPNGAEDCLCGFVPPPGYYFLNYFEYYSADQFKSDNGNDLIPGFDLHAAANVFRFLYVTKQQILGGNWAVHMFVPLVNLEVTLPPLGEQGRAGLGDIIVDPFILSWHFNKNWHLATGVDVYIPTGRYDQEDFANIGRNYWTFEPIVAATFLSDSGFEMSGKFMYDFNTKNTDSFFGDDVSGHDYLSGQEFHFDYAITQGFGGWRAGLAGYYYNQLTNDELNDEKYLDGFRGQAFALGPLVQYQYKNMFLTAKYQFETAVENKPKGDKFWLKFFYAF